MRSVWGSGAGDVYIATQFRVLEFNGTDFDEVYEATAINRGAELHGTGPNDIWFVRSTDLGDASHFDGSQWKRVRIGAVDLSSVWAVEGGPVYAAGQGGAIVRLDR